LKQRSFFLFGPRGAGKTWFVRESFKGSPNFVSLNLLKENIYLELISAPERLRNYVNYKNSPQWIFVDEVQRVPALLNTVHDILEDPETHGKVFFVLTGSSARKLKRGGANLLAGRGLVYNLYPLSTFETAGDWDLSNTLHWGQLPQVVTAESDELRREILQAYVGTYLREEIKEEQIVRQIEPFVRFLEAAAQANGTIIQYSNIARSALVDAKAVGRYFEILEDTLAGFFLEPFAKSVRERTVAKSKFYFFDPGVKRALDRNLDTPLRPGTYAWGKAFEHYFILECIRLNSYSRKNARFSYLMTKDGAEIDLIIECSGRRPLCVEIKSSESVAELEIRKLKQIASAVPDGQPLVVYAGLEELTVDNIRVVPWKKLLTELFGFS
jgi:predicted AAA+ superfamily ATPase